MGETSTKASMEALKRVMEVFAKVTSTQAFMKALMEVMEGFADVKEASAETYVKAFLEVR